MPTSRKEKLPPAVDRRFDSLGWLMQPHGTDCGAACFVGDKLILTTNRPNFHGEEVKELRNSIIQHISDLARLVHSEMNKLEVLRGKDKSEFRSELKKTNETIKESIKQNEIGLINKARKLNVLTNEGFEENFVRSFTNLRRSILYSYLKPKSEQAWPKEIVLSIMDRKNIHFINENSGVHAEMKIAQYLLDNKKLDDGKTTYIGISKRCCLHCETAIEAINAKKRYEAITVRDNGSQNCYKSGIPPFLEKDKSLQAIFLKLFNSKLKEKYGKDFKAFTSIKEAFHSDDYRFSENNTNHEESPNFSEEFSSGSSDPADFKRFKTISEIGKTFDPSKFKDKDVKNLKEDKPSLSTTAQINSNIKINTTTQSKKVPVKFIESKEEVRFQDKSNEVKPKIPKYQANKSTSSSSQQDAKKLTSRHHRFIGNNAFAVLEVEELKPSNKDHRHRSG